MRYFISGLIENNGILKPACVVDAGIKEFVSVDAECELLDYGLHTILQDGQYVLTGVDNGDALACELLGFLEAVLIDPLQAPILGGVE